MEKKLVSASKNRHCCFIVYFSSALDIFHHLPYLHIVFVSSYRVCGSIDAVIFPVCEVPVSVQCGECAGHLGYSDPTSGLHGSRYILTDSNRRIR